MIQIKSLTKNYDDNSVLMDISLTLKEHKTHILLGSSGCGKSTLLRIMLGLLPADTGKVFVGDISVMPERQGEVARKSGYVIQRGGLFPHLTARDNITLMAKVQRWSPEEIEMRISDLYQLMDFGGDILDQYPVQLSGGQCQRVAIMRALMLDPEYLFLDEPLGGLDPIVRASLQKEFKVLFRSLKKTVVFVTHDMAEAAYFGDTVTLLNEGRVEQHGTVRDLFKSPDNGFVKDFINAQRPLYMNLEEIVEEEVRP